MRATLRFCIVGLALFLLTAGNVKAGIIFNTMPDNPASTPETLLGRSIMSVLNVGPSDVQITGFGTFGRLNADGNVKWVIFGTNLGSSPLFSTGPVSQPASAVDGWYDSPTIAFTLLANTSYRLGLMADQFFTYNWDFPGVAVSQGGLSVPANANSNAENFASPVLTAGGGVVNSLRVFGDTQAVPEPTSLAIFGLSALGMVGMGLRRKQKA